MKPTLAKRNNNQNKSKELKTRNKSAIIKGESYDESNLDLQLVEKFLVEVAKVMSSLNYPD